MMDQKKVGAKRGSGEGLGEADIAFKREIGIKGIEGELKTGG